MTNLMATVLYLIHKSRKEIFMKTFPKNKAHVAISKKLHDHALFPEPEAHLSFCNLTIN